MATEKHSQHIPWIAIGVGGVALAVGAAVLLRLPPAPQPVERPEPIAVNFRKLGDDAEDVSLREEIALQDPTPLFLPTEWNTSRATTEIQREPAAALRNFPPQLAFGEGNPEISFPRPVEVPASPEAALKSGSTSDLLHAFGQRDSRVPAALPGRFAALRVARAADGTPVAITHAPDGTPVWQDELPAVEGTPAGDWSPVDILAAIGPGGLVGTPVLTASSGFEEMDVWLPRYLAKTYRLGERLRPGFYRISVGP